MTNNLVKFLLIMYFAHVCHSNEVLNQGFTSYDDYYPEENNDFGKVMQKDGSNPFLLYPPECGFSNGEHNRVINGTSAASGAWPWMAPIFISRTGSPSDDKYECGGTIISERHILTATHCIDSTDVNYAVHLGITNIHDEGVRIMAENVTVHENFTVFPFVNDIAILRLKEKINFTDNIRPICLPLSPEIRNKNFTRNYTFVVGWGVTIEGGEDSDILLEAQIPVVSNSICESLYDRDEETAPLFDIDDRVLCAGYPHGGTDACQGDSGGPLMFPMKNIYYLIGVVSGGWSCADPNYPGVYTRVTSFLDFILDNMN